MKFAAFGDIGNTSNICRGCQADEKPGRHLRLPTGDLCYGSRALATQINANYAVEKSKTSYGLRSAITNSPKLRGRERAQGYLSYFTLPGNERYYDFKRGPVHFFALNSYKDADGVSATSKQAMWLKDKLAASTYPWKIVFFHHPPYSSGEHGSNNYMRWPFEAWGADAVLSGHDHDYERIMRDVNNDGTKIPYFVSGLGGQSRRSFGSTTLGKRETL